MSDEELQDLHRRLSARGRHRAELSQLSGLSGSDLARLAAIEHGTRKKLFDRMSPIVLGAYVVFFSVAIAELLFHYQGLDGLRLLSGVVLSLGTVARSGAAPRSQAREAIAAALEETDRVDAVPAALELFQMGQIRKNFTTESAPAEESLRVCLKRLLPKVEPESTADWTREQRIGLLVALAEPMFDTELTLCCLRVLAFAGTAEALPVIRRLAGGRIAYHPQIRLESLRVLPLLEDRLARGARTDRLLRPAEPTDEVVLLRAAKNSAARPSDELLRTVGAQTTDPTATGGAN